jgi:hypothetical protein
MRTARVTNTARRIASPLGALILAPIIVGVVVFYLTVGFPSGEKKLTATAVVLLRPFTGTSLNGGVKVGRRVDGRCVMPSESSGSPEAARCFGDSTIYDPCYVGSNEHLLACFLRPWDPTVTLVHSSNAVQANRASDELSLGHRRPFGYELTNGERCRFIEGAGQVTVFGVRVNYSCDHGDTIGNPDRAHAIWTATFAPHHSSETREVAIAKAWP